MKKSSMVFFMFLLTCTILFAENPLIPPPMSPQMQQETERLLRTYPVYNPNIPDYGFEDHRDCSSRNYIFGINLSENGSNENTHKIVSLANCGGNFVTPLKSQGDFGTCWAFGRIATIETALMVELKANRNMNDDNHQKVDLSEAFLAHLRNYNGQNIDLVYYARKTWHTFETAVPYVEFTGEHQEHDDAFLYDPESDHTDNWCEYKSEDFYSPFSSYYCSSFPRWVQKMYRKKYPEIWSCRNVKTYEDEMKCISDAMAMKGTQFVKDSRKTLDANECKNSDGETVDYACIDNKIKNIINNGFTLQITIDSDKFDIKDEYVDTEGVYPFLFQRTEAINNNNIGYHAVVIIGYAESINGTGKDYYIVKNSWSDQVKKNTMLLMPTPSTDSEMQKVFMFCTNSNCDNIRPGSYVADLTFGTLDKKTGEMIELDESVVIQDYDSDGFPDWLDSCPFTYDDGDRDGDGLNDSCDMCPELPETDKKNQNLYISYPEHNRAPDLTYKAFDGDKNRNGIPDICERSVRCSGHDSDADGIGSSCDNCPNNYNPLQHDSDGDGDGDTCDPCPFKSSINISSPGEDTDGDGLSDRCDICSHKASGYLTLAALSDIDGDKVPDFCDGCPSLSNQDFQHDSDGDGIADVCDSCPERWNYMKKISHYTEIINNMCRKKGIVYPSGREVCIDGGHKAMYYTQKYGYYLPSGEDYNWQPDHDLDGEADVCDDSWYYSRVAGVESTPFSPTNPTKNSVLQLFVFAQGDYEKVSLENFEKRIVTPSGIPHKINNNPDWLSTSLKIFGNLTIPSENTLHFCGYDINNMENQHLDEDGVPDEWKMSCQVSGAHMGRGSASHGSTIGVIDSTIGRPRWEHISWSRDKNEAKKIPFNAEDDPEWSFNSKYKSPLLVAKGQMKKNVYWNWRADAWLHLNCFDDADSYFCQTLKRADNDSVESTFFYTLSSAQKGMEDNYITQDDNYINVNYFADKLFYARSDRFTVYAQKVSYITTTLSWDPDLMQEILQKSFHLLKNTDLTMTYSNIPGLSDVRFSTLGEIIRVPITVPDNFVQIFDDGVGTRYMITHSLNHGDGVKKYFLKEMLPGGSWIGVGEILNYPANLTKIAATVFEGTVYIAGKTTGDNIEEKTLNILEKGDQAFTFKKISTLPDDVENIKMFSTDNSLYLAGNSGSQMKTYQFTKAGMNFVDTGFSGPSSRETYYIKAIENDFFFAGGISSGSGERDLWHFSPESGWENISTDLGTDLYAVLMEKHKNTLVLINPYPSKNTNTTLKISVDLSDYSNITREIVKLPWESTEQDFCIKESDGTIFPGIFTYGVCEAASDYNYESIYYFDYKRSVAGYENNLYLAGLSGVRRIEIQESGNLKKRELILTGEIHNLALHGSTLYGANGGEIEIFSIEEDGTISESGEINASSCRNVRVYKDMLFTAEKGKVNIYDLSDPLSPSLIKTIYTSGKVLDLEVLDDKLYLYKEKTKWFFITKGYTEIYNISNLTAPEKVSSFKQRCWDSEMESSEGRVYLGCANGQFRVENSGLITVSGKKNYLREGFVHNNILYQVFSGALHKSTVMEE